MDGTADRDLGPATPAGSALAYAKMEAMSGLRAAAEERTEQKGRPTVTAAASDEARRATDLAYRFDDEYWDEAFGTLYDPTMRVCSTFGCC